MIQVAAGLGVDQIVDHRPTPREIPRPACSLARPVTGRSLPERTRRAEV